MIAGLVVGGGVGAVLARRVQMTDMPQLVAAFNGFGGGASALVAAAEMTSVGDDDVRTLVSIAISVAIGSITFSGSMVAFGKLQGIVSGTPIVFPLQKIVDVLLALATAAAAVAIVTTASMTPLWILVGVTLVLGGILAGVF